MKSRPQTYTIGQVAKLTGLPAYTIRYWEQEFKSLHPRKSRTGRRVYTEDDLQMVRRIQDLLHSQGYTIKGAREALKEGFTAARRSAARSRETVLRQKLITIRRQLRELLEIISSDGK